MFTLLTGVLLFSIFVALLRFVRGKTLSDRLVAFDVLGLMSLSLLIILALYFERALYLDIALVIGLIGFLGSAIFGRYIEKGI